MRPKALFVGPWWWAISRTDSNIEGVNALWARLSEVVDHEPYAWPNFKARSGDPSWQAIVAEMRRQMPDGGYLIDVGPAGVLSLLAVSGEPKVKALVMGGMFVPPATLRALGMNHQADGCSALFRTNRAHQLARLNLQGAPEEFIRQVGEQMDAGLDWERTAELQRSFESINLLENRPDVRIPVLYMDPPLAAAGFAEMAGVLLDFVPHARIQPTEVYPMKMQDAAASVEFAEKALVFIDEIEKGSG